MAARWHARKILGMGLLVLALWLLRRPAPRPAGLYPASDDIKTEPLAADSLTATPGRGQQDAEYSASRAAHEFCATYGFSVFQPRGANRRRIYDLVMVNTELDFLEIRLNTLFDHVDYFIVVESPKTFQGQKKRLFIKENWGQFRQYHEKMVYHELIIPANFDPPRAWDYEDLQRDAMLEQVMLNMDGPPAPVQGDVIIVADVDEIPRPQSLSVLRSCKFPRRLTLASKFYYYSFQFLHAGPEWPHPQATFYQGQYTLKPTNLRNGDGGFALLRGREKGVLGNASWHCSSCFATMEQFLNKMASFSHGWMNSEEYRDREKIATAVREGRDLWGRDEEIFVRIENNTDIPPLVAQDPDRFRYMVNRDGPAAGFADYPERA